MTCTPPLVPPDSGQLPTSTADGSVLLDLAHDRFIKLNGVGAEIWQRLSAGQPEAEVVQVLAQQYSVAEERVAADVHALRARLTALGMVPEPAPLPPGPPQPAQANAERALPWYAYDGQTVKPTARWTTVVWGLLGLLAFDVVLALGSLKLLCNCIKRFPVTQGRSPDAATVALVAAAVEQACVWYPRAAVCLPRAAVTTCLLRRTGAPARLVIGVRPMPFLAHAWVELEGRVINDWARVPRFYPTLAVY